MGNHACGRVHGVRNNLNGRNLPECSQVPEIACIFYRRTNSREEYEPITREARATEWIKREARVPGRPPKRKPRAPYYRSHPTAPEANSRSTRWDPHPPSPKTDRSFSIVSPNTTGDMPSRVSRSPGGGFQFTSLHPSEPLVVERNTRPP